MSSSCISDALAPLKKGEKNTDEDAVCARGVWQNIGFFLAGDLSADAQAVRLRLSLQAQPVGVVLPWNIVDVYEQYLLKRDLVSRDCLLSYDEEQTVVQNMVLEANPDALQADDALGKRLRNRLLVLRAVSSSHRDPSKADGNLVTVSNLEPSAFLADGDGFEAATDPKQLGKGDYSGVLFKGWTRPAHNKEEDECISSDAMAFLDSQLSSDGRSVPDAMIFEILTGTFRIKLAMEDDLHMVATCLTRFCSRNNAVLACMSRDRQLCEEVPVLMKRKGGMSKMVSNFMKGQADKVKWVKELNDVMSKAVSAGRCRGPAITENAHKKTDAGKRLQVEKNSYPSWPFIASADAQPRDIYKIKGVIAQRPRWRQPYGSIF